MVSRSFIFERAKLTRCRQEGETADMSISVLHALSERYGFGEVKGEPIRDKIAVRLKDSKLSEKTRESN